MTITPATTEDLSAALKAATAHNRTLTPTGGRTKLTWGHPITTDQEISTKSLSGVHEHSWQDLTATVAAGTTWQTMQQTLAQHNQRVALDPLFPDQATVGGILSTNDSGLLRMRYGSLRDLVLGMTIVLADGAIARTGGKVVKNVAGYDLPKLLTGSFGTLGIITEATFRLHPLQPHAATFTIRSSDIAALAQLMQQLVTAAMALESMQLRNISSDDTEPETFALDVQFAALPEALAEHEHRLRALATNLTLEPALTDIFAAREQLFANPTATILKLTTLPNKLAALVSAFHQLDRTPNHTARCIADPVGIVTVALTAPPDALASILDDLRSRLRSTGGSAIILQRGELDHAIDPWHNPQDPPPALDVMRAIKHEFDPSRLLNPGKFVGGL
jgi:glycolate oxidase FAD binding subunit